MLSILGMLFATIAGCVWPFSSGPTDITVERVDAVNLLNEPQVAWLGPGERPSKLILRADFTTKSDLFALAKRNDYNVYYAVTRCGTKESAENLGPFMGVFWGRMQVSDSSDGGANFATAIAAGKKIHYQVYFTLDGADRGAIFCLALAGGNMLGGRLRSNEAQFRVP